uniref:hypothetical protein n=1 Tax=Anabaena sp. CCY 0017 TaxID=3103866 RepID=UPI0039C687FD
MPNFYNNVKVRLNKSGYKIAKAEIMAAAEYLRIQDTNNATTELTGRQTSLKTRQCKQCND